jgi:transketolase
MGEGMPKNATPLDRRSCELRRTMVRMMQAAKRGHLVSAFSCVEILRVLYDDVMRYDAADPRMPDRDRCILSKGHGCLALYVLLAEKGFFAEEELWTFCKPDSILGGHPEYGKIPGVEASTGSLGHGLPIGIGFALNAKLAGRGYRTFVVGSDGESDEGSVWEAAMCAAKHRLDNLVLAIDYNEQQSYSTTHEVLELEPFADKWRAFGFAVREVDGHDVAALREALADTPLEAGKPTAIICHTLKGKGAASIECDLSWHHRSNPSAEELEGLIAELEPEDA